MPIESGALRRGQAKEARLNGARLPSAESLRREVATLVFTPDRLAVVKGGPAARRAYFDRVLGASLPARAGMPQDYLAALAQRNAALRRVQLGCAARGALEPWTERIAELGAALVEAAARRSRRSRRRSRSAPASSACRMRGSAYDAEAPTVETRGAAGARPRARRDRARPAPRRRARSRAATATCASSAHRASSGWRCSRCSWPRRGCCLLPPLLLLDDVLSELDLGRRRVLAERVAGMGQTVITATHARRSRPSRRRSCRWSMDPLGRRGARRAVAVRPPGRHGRALERWPAAVGEAIARNAWPAGSRGTGPCM